MRILYVTTHLNTGGITSYVFSLAAALRKRGHEVFVASGPGSKAEIFKDTGITCFSLPVNTKLEVHPVKLPRSVGALTHIIGGNTIDVVHSQTRVTQVACCLAQKVSPGFAHVTTCHGFFRRRISRRLFPCWGDAVIAISDAVQKHLTGDFRVPGEKVHLIYNGIDTQRFAPSHYAKAVLRAALGLPAGFLAGIVARLSDVKGHRYLIEAISLLHKHHRQVHLVMVGEGPEYGALRSLVSKRGLQETVSFLPTMADTPRFLSALDAFVMPSLQEGLGLSLMEAMACACPVIGSRVGGIPHLIEHNRTGLLVPPADPDGIASALVLIMQHPEKAQQMACQARELIAERFSLESMVSKTEECYRKCVNG